MEPAPLNGLRVVDLTSTFMGPYCTLLLRQWGADVVKVESPQGDVVRYIGDRNGTGMGPIFLNANRGKRSVGLDLKRDGSRAVLRHLLDVSDIVVHSLRPAAARRLGLAPADVLADNPRIGYLGFRGYGPGGPYEDLPAYDDVIQAASGTAALQAADGESAYVRSSMADKTVGLMGAAAVLAALHGRDASGLGQVVEIPMYETMVGFNLLEQQSGRVFEPAAGPSGYPRTQSPHRKPYRTKDGAIAVMVYTDDQWRVFFDEVGRSELIQDPRFRTIRERTIHSDELYSLVESAMVVRTTDEWLEQLRLIGIAASRVNSLDDLFTEPHLAATGFFHSVDHPTEGRLVLPSMPGPVGDDEGRWLAPWLGQHTRAVMGELGYGSDEISALFDQRVLFSGAPSS